MDDLESIWEQGWRPQETPDEIENRVRVTRTIVAGKTVFDARGSV